MALEHALLVALSERPGSGLELAGRFEKSIGFFWHATHQQIYRVLGRMEKDGWLSVETVPQTGRPDKRVYSVSESGASVLADWLAEPLPMETFRSDLAVKLRAAAYGERQVLLDRVRETLADHEARLAHYLVLEKRDYPVPGDLAALDRFLVLRGGIRLEEFWIGWLNEYLEAHS
ncbi:PadR family transcriptional regulator [Nocardioides currus]|uniref:PadR family transcriptional regulator n=1 Tax=Nocardioides currus TaxID=2133958 RepID=A0A2R7YY85_9ACTN|nr:PadR family transcriptional regulator [Nocardioides currus]PUA81311.1 PadR family transcriptional regulator [Nocardioides currus]